ncbi:TRAP transporter large permease subunit [Caballeronia sp. LZ033]|uniref:TRAP transporter large permease subunit n=1 Tax=Caballeronia sp. LZ033 TaxID=3038566 RepID=UPI0038D46A21
MWAIAFGAGLLGLGVPVAICIGIAATIAVALQSAAGSLGLLSPVSMSMLVYACTANVSVGTMFIAGIIPMLLVVASFMIVNYVTAVRNDYSAVEPFDLARLALVERPESTA